MQISEIKKNIEKILDNNKAQNITSIDLKNKSYIADYMIIASGTSSRHLQSLSEILVSELKKNDSSIGVLVCGTGIGMSIAANRYNHIRGALCTDENMAKLSRKHNNANVLILGGRTTSFKSAKKMIEIFLNTEFEFGRHSLRLEKI